MPKQPESRISEQAIESVIAEAAQRIRDIIMPGHEGFEPNIWSF
jgi:predicted fused transcriptional regulator/phosphomethylpyrimidine kinase